MRAYISPRPAFPWCCLAGRLTKCCYMPAKALCHAITLPFRVLQLSPLLVSPSVPRLSLAVASLLYRYHRAGHCGLAASLYTDMPTTYCLCPTAFSLPAPAPALLWDACAAEPSVHCRTGLLLACLQPEDNMLSATTSVQGSPLSCSCPRGLRQGSAVCNGIASFVCLLLSQGLRGGQASLGASSALLRWCCLLPLSLPLLSLSLPCLPFLYKTAGRCRCCFCARWHACGLLAKTDGWNFPYAALRLCCAAAALHGVPAGISPYPFLHL